MADNYLERRQQELQEKRPVIKRSAHSLDSLLKKNRSYRGFDQRHEVSEDELKQIVAVSTLVASGMNRQRLRYRLVTKPDAGKVLPHITLGAALPEEHLPHPGSEPQAFIVVCATEKENKVIDIDLGIAAQSMLLKAVEMGLGGIFILNFRAAAVQQALNLPSEPIAIIAIGKPAEKIFLVPVHTGSDLNYYRKDGIHYVPKLSIEDLII
ncbi:MAG: nitroreductase family protein [Bacteroidales bacterium]|nr:nitroreductase family protein [Bacteroidales bacterium]MBQ9529045.1 nitroreductase family protein [Bacteroidales bacterium]